MMNALRDHPRFRSLAMALVLSTGAALLAPMGTVGACVHDGDPADASAEAHAGHHGDGPHPLGAPSEGEPGDDCSCTTHCSPSSAERVGNPSPGAALVADPEKSFPDPLDGRPHPSTIPHLLPYALGPPAS